MTELNVRHQAVLEVTRHGRLMFDVARQYGLPTKTLYHWVSESKQLKVGGPHKGLLTVLEQLKAKYFS